MKTFRIKQTIAALWLALALTFGSGFVATQFGVDTIPSTHACGLGAGSGGGC
ncbi:MAG: hypothetical protein KC423_00825 [Anaerolineales bacterium]|nr:hypothetical protein [Anaerolineales bacterium]